MGLFLDERIVIKMRTFEKTEKTLKLKREKSIITSIYFGVFLIAVFPFAFLQQYALPNLILVFSSNISGGLITLENLFSMVISVGYILIGIWLIYIILTFEIGISCCFDKNYNQVILEKFSVLRQERTDKKPLTSISAVEVTTKLTLESSPDETYQISLRFNSSEKFQLSHNLSRTEVSELAGEIEDFLSLKVYGLPK